MADSTGITTYSYDLVNQLTGVTSPGSRRVGHTYDAAGNRTTLSYPGSGSVTYGYNGDEQLTSVVDWQSTGHNTTSYGYDKDARLATVTLPATNRTSNVVGTYAYFGTSALASITWQLGSTTLVSVTYTLNLNSNTLRRVLRSGTVSPRLGELCLQRRRPHVPSPAPCLVDVRVDRTLTEPPGLGFHPSGNTPVREHRHLAGGSLHRTQAL